MTTPTARPADPVLVTGGTGFLAGRIIAQTLTAGYRVRTTLRSKDKAAQMRRDLTAMGTAPDTLEFTVADLTADAGWADAITGCRYVLHVASPYPAGAPAHEDDLIVPARDGTLRVLRAASDAGVERVVVTSSFAAVGCGR